MFPFDHFLLENNSTNACQRVIVLFTIERPAKNVLSTFGGGVVVFSWGAHCNDPGCVRSFLAENLLPFVRGSHINNIYPHWKFLYRESEPQHFDTPGGNFVKGLRRGQCVPTRGTGNNWRNEEAAGLLTEYNLTKRVPIVRIWHALEPLWQLHDNQYSKNADCTHYCYSPWRFDVTWDGMMKALRGMQDNVVTLSARTHEMFDDLNQTDTEIQDNMVTLSARTHEMFDDLNQTHVEIREQLQKTMLNVSEASAENVILSARMHEIIDDLNQTNTALQDQQEVAEISDASTGDSVPDLQIP